MLSGWCIAPQFFDLVKLSWVGHHHMNDNIYIIDQYPLLPLPSFMFKWQFTNMLFHFFFHKISDGPELRGIA